MPLRPSLKLTAVWSLSFQPKACETVAPGTTICVHTYAAEMINACMVSPSKRRNIPLSNQRGNRRLLLPHQPQLAHRFDVLLVQLEHAVEALLRQLQIPHHLRHVAEEEVRRQALVDHLDRLLAVARALRV